MRWLAIDKCPHGVYAISLDDEGGGLRLTRTKCCGQWNRVKAWPLTAKQLREMANKFECAADDIQNLKGD